MKKIYALLAVVCILGVRHANAQNVLTITNNSSVNVRFCLYVYQACSTSVYNVTTFYVLAPSATTTVSSTGYTVSGTANFTPSASDVFEGVKAIDACWSPPATLSPTQTTTIPGSCITGGANPATGTHTSCGRNVMGSFDDLNSAAPTLSFQ